jgi:hypothetical protein
MKYLLTKIEYFFRMSANGSFYNCHAELDSVSQFNETLKRVQGDIKV